MSDDDFDKEEERERLREKYEQDKQKREASERMSELLLQGATMTNQHCPECHSPVFSYEGTEFCPTCQREVTAEGDLAGDADDGTAAPADTPTNGEAGTRPEAGGAEADDADTGTGAGAREPAEPADDGAGRPAGDARTADERATAREGRTGADRRVESDDEETRPAPARERQPARVDPPARREEPTADRAGADREGLDDAEAALIREIANLTRRAEETRDVGRKREFFAAAREAAETLETVRRL